MVAPTVGFAQDDINIPKLDLDQADVRDALKIIFKHAGKSWSIEQTVQGIVTVHLENIPFETALRNVLGQVDATYRIEGGIYVILPKPTPLPTDTGLTVEIGTEFITRKIYIRHADPSLIVNILIGEANIGMMPETTAVVLGGSGGGGGGFGGGQFGGGGGRGGFGGGQFGGGGGGGFGGGGFAGGGGGGGGSGYGR